MEETKKTQDSAGKSAGDVNKKAKNRKKLKYGSLATGITLIFIAAVVLVNVVVSQLMNRFPNLKLDLTANHVYEISAESIDYIKNLNQKVEIGVSVDESTLEDNQNYKMIKETLEKYQGYSDEIEVEYFDTAKDPDILSKYQDIYGSEIEAGCVIVTSNNRAKVYDMINLFDIDEETYQQYYYYGANPWYFITGFKGEQVLTTAIMNVTDSNPKNVGVIAYNNQSLLFYGSYDDSVSGVMRLLDENGYNLSVLDISSDTLDPETYDILVLPAPTSDLTTDTVSQLSDFLYNDGNYGKQLVYFADYTQQSDMPNLTSFLKDWCVSIENSVVVDENGGTSQQVSLYGSSRAVTAPIVTVAEEASDYAGGLANASLPIVAPSARPIDLVSTNNERNVIPLLETSATSYRYPLEALLGRVQEQQSASLESPAEDADSAEETTQTEATTTTFDTTATDKASNTVMALVQNQYSTGSEILESDVLVLGSIQMLDYNLTADAAYNNAQFFISALNTICGKEDSIVVASKDLNITSISATETQISVIKTIVVWAIPICVAMVGIVVFIRRRNR